MLCPECYGKGMVIANDNLEPCSECHGSGLVHCCEGLIEQQEPLGKEFEGVLFDNLWRLYAR